MKKLYVLLLAMLPLFMAGCGGGKTASDKIVGTWDCVSLILDGEESAMDLVGISLTITFKADKTWNGAVEGVDANLIPIPTSGGTYTISDTNILLIHSSGEYSWDIRSLTDNRAEFLWPDHKQYTGFDNDEVILVFAK